MMFPKLMVSLNSLILLACSAFVFASSASSSSIEAVDSNTFRSIHNASLPAGFTLEKGQRVFSFNGQYHLEMQGDGDLVLYAGRYPKWSTNTINSSATRFVVQGDGNLVLYTGNGQPVWSSTTHGNPGARLYLQDDGNLVLRKNQTALWNTATYTSNFVAAKSEFDYSGAIWSRQSKIIKTTYPSSDIVVADYDVVEDFSADFSGLNDSTAAIQQALDQCFNEGGGTVWLPKGRYKISNTVNVPAFCTLRGDWNDPDHLSFNGDYGTLVEVNLPPGINGPNAFRIGGSAGVNGLTIYYPEQNIENPIAYNNTFDIPGGGINYMMSSVINVTLLNAYQGIGVSTRDGEIHEVSTVKNVKGTVLYQGITAFNGADVGVWRDIKLSNEYWANAGSYFNAPNITELNNWTKNHGTGFVLGDVEWDQFLDIEASYYNIGIHIVPGRRISFAGSFVDARITDTNTALLVDDLDSRWGIGFVSSILNGDNFSIVNNSNGYVISNHTDIQGAFGGAGAIYHVDSPQEVPPSYVKAPHNKSSREVLYDVTQSPYSAPRILPNREGVIPIRDATSAIQRALNQAGSDGGGLVYLPPGWYRVNGNLDVPANVELRGASSTPHRDQVGLSLGTVLFASNGHNISNSNSAPALVTLSGDQSGVSGLRFFYPENRPDQTIVPYPFSIRGRGTGNYVTNIGFANTWNGIDFMSHVNESHVIERIVGTVFHRGILAAGNKKGWISDVLSNGNASVRNGFGIHGWLSDLEVFERVINPVTRVTETLLVTNTVGDEYISNVFAYGAQRGIEHQGGLAKVFNMGTDNLGDGGYTVFSYDHIYVLNALRYNGSESTNGANGSGITLYNDIILGQSAPVFPAPVYPKTEHRMGQGSILEMGESLSSPNGLYKLIMQHDGNLVLYNQNMNALWSTSTHGNPGSHLVFQYDGNVVLYNKNSSQALWSTQSASSGAAFFQVQDDANVVLYDQFNMPLWTRN